MNCNILNIFKIEHNRIITCTMLIVLLAFGMFSFVGCKTKQATSEDIKCINENHYFYTGASPEEIGKQIYKNFLWSNVNVSDREFKGKVYVRFFMNYKNEFSDITILTKTNSPSIDAELMRCVKLIKIRKDHKIDKEAKIEVIATVTF